MIKAILFDFMGTCLDWHSSILPALPSTLSHDAKSDSRSNGAKPTSTPTPRGSHPEIKPLFSEEVQEKAVAAWHHQKAWPDVAAALRKLKEDCGLEIYVHANGTTRLQLDLVRSSGLKFDMLFSSELLGCYKPAPENYRRALGLLKLRADECVTVAAHTSDLRGAKAVGMKTVYVRRETDDVWEDQEVIRSENDVYLEDMQELDKRPSAAIAALGGNNVPSLTHRCCVQLFP
ncbi:(S)-2-haloacid dehalogenase IVA [Mycena pura]|uniref:(S)-2-haloacid dehalogenase IVA n=1 Tax=Mycena pura TaxID=153505 RepID=A0AAD6UQL3_9AGAR|nr:(S)-2-haloacid dehalogenase IVA [Mycena pura]